MNTDLRNRLMISTDRIEAINKVLLNPDSKVINEFLAVVERYGTPEEINKKAHKARDLDNLMARVKEKTPAYYEDLLWLIEKRDQKAFIHANKFTDQYRQNSDNTADPNYAVTLEISALQYFPWLKTIAQIAIDESLLMPGRFIRVRKMKEQEEDGDVAAVAAAMQIIGASYVETLDTKGTDGSNIHLGGPDTITGYFGGVGQPNTHALKWLDEFLYFYTEYGVQQVLNVNPGTVLLGYFLHRIGVDIEFKISVFMGNDNPYSALWTLLTAKLFSREDGSSPLIGFNWGNSVDNTSIETTAQFRKEFGLEDIVRFEHHITETYKHIVLQPYNRRDELMEIAGHVANISAKHEGGEPEIDSTRDHPSDILDYFRDKTEVITSGDWDALELNFMDKFRSVNDTAKALVKNNLPFLAANKLHHY